MEHSIEFREIRDDNDLLGCIVLVEALMRHMKLPFVKDGSLLRAEVGWVRVGLSGMPRLEVLSQSLELRQVFQ